MNNDSLYVCPNCFSDSGICDFIKDAASAVTCSFCNNSSTSPIAAPIEEVAEHINSCLYEEYADAANHLPYETAEGGYIGDWWDTWDLLFDEIELDLPNDIDGRLSQDLLSRLDDNTWCEAHPFSLNDQQMAHYSWDRFCEVVKHQRRFFLTSEVAKPDDDEIYSPGEVLLKIFEYAQMAELFVTLPNGSQLLRARFQEPDECLETVQQLGPPLPERATQSNRMSPPGIVMFYASDDPETALRETANGPGTFVLGGFESCRPAIVLDLAGIPPVPSLFQELPDSLEFRPREVIGFLTHVAREMSRPIERDDRINIDYVPTQVVTEYVRSRLLWGDERVDGIRYTSAVHPGHVSYVLFATQDNVLPIPNESEAHQPAEDDKWLRLVAADTHVVTSEQISGWRQEEELTPRFLGRPWSES